MINELGEKREKKLKGNNLLEEVYGIFCNTIERYGLLENIENLTFLFSGGKDATLGLFFLNKYIVENELIIDLEAILVDYPKHVYYENGKEAECFTETKRFWKEQNVNLKILVSLEEDFEDDEINACKVCKNSRKDLVDGYLEGLGANKRAVATGYTLYDALAYVDEICLSTNFTNNMRDEKIEKRMQNCLHKMKAKENLPNGLTMIRPLISLKEDKIMELVIDMGLPYVDRGCKASKSKHKREYFKVLSVASPIENTTYEGLLQFIEALGIEMPMTFDDIDMGNYFTDC